MSGFKIGDTVRLVDAQAMDAPVGALAEVRGGDGDYTVVHWLTPTEQRDGAYLAGRFALTTDDSVNHPAHYKHLPVEVIEITKHFDFLLGNVLKYVLRHEHKGKPLEDLKKAQWYLAKAIAERETKQ